MNITCSLDKFKRAINLAEKMSGKNLTLPILQSILLFTSEKYIKIRSTNLAVGVEIDIPAEIKEGGSVLINGNILANVCNNISDTKDLKIRSDGNSLIIETIKTNTKIKCLSNEDFPTLPKVEGDSFQIKNSIFKEGIRSVYFASAVSEIKPEISSIFIFSENEHLYFTATDSFRLAEKKNKVTGIPEISKILLPFKNIQDTLKVLDEMDENIKISYTRNQISISDGSIYFTSRLIDGGFPAYQVIIPKDETTKIVAMKQDIISSLRLATVFVDKFFQVVLDISPKEKRVTITSKNNDIGSSVNILDSVSSGEPIEVVFNLRYLMDVFQSIHGDSVSISLTQPNKPIVIKDVNDKNFLYLLMPTNR